MSHTAPLLLTPGPITTSLTTKEAMLQDWGSWDEDFRLMTDQLCQRLINIAHAEETHVCVPVQGSGTFAVEATLGTLIPPQAKTLVLMNGAYGQRIGKILDYMGRHYITLDKGDYEPPRAHEVEAILNDNPDIAYVTLIHCETSSGILNPVAEIAECVARLGRHLIIDAMSSFGAIEINAEELPFAALISSANKCFEGVPGFGFALIQRDLLQQSKGQAHSLSLDLYDQWHYMEQTRQWRFTPPTHTVAAFMQALDEHAAEGGVAGRCQRYLNNQQTLVTGMRQLGFETLLDDAWLSPIIVTFFAPKATGYDFTAFYNLLKTEGFIIYPGKLTQADSFRIGCIGQQTSADVKRLLGVIAKAATRWQ